MTNKIIYTPNEAHEKLINGTVSMVDVRSAEEFEKGHIINSVNLAAATLEEKQKELEKYKDKTVIICCNQGQESIRIARILKMKGLEKLFCLKGGIAAWRNANLPLTKNT
ncbi:MAG: rhodanese-like domain-containing protein [Gammaproteobacteria bacterium]|nr:rhodanese-like domain-containing protein [Gammaproteobacteria bacterium]